MSPYGTRATNANAHPGLVDIDPARKKRRSPEEIAAAKKAEELRIRGLEVERALLIERIAQLEALSRATEDDSVGPSAPPTNRKSKSK